MMRKVVKTDHLSLRWLNEISLATGRVGEMAGGTVSGLHGDCSTVSYASECLCIVLISANEGQCIWLMMLGCGWGIFLVAGLFQWLHNNWGFFLEDVAVQYRW